MSQRRSLEQMHSSDWPEDPLATLVSSLFSSASPQRNAGQRFVSRTMLGTTKYGSQCPVLALRVVIANPLTAELNIPAVLDEQVWRAQELERQRLYAAAGR